VAVKKIDLAKEIADRDGDYAVTYYGKRRIEVVNFGEINLKRDYWWMRIFPTSALPSEPSARIATLDEWVNSGLISKSDYKRLADFPDLEDAMTLETAQYDLCEEIVDLMLVDGKSYVVEPLQDKQLFARIALMMYTRAKLEGLADPKSAYPEENMQLVRQFIADCLAPEPGQSEPTEGGPAPGEVPAPGASAGPVPSAPVPAGPPPAPPPGAPPPPVNAPPSAGPPS
jgi:hypothetical protein